MDDAVAVCELQAAADLDGNLQCARERGSMLRSRLDQAFDVAAAHELGDDVGLGGAGGFETRL